MAENPTGPQTSELDTSKLVNPQKADSSDEATPLADEAEVAVKAKDEPTPVYDETAKDLAFHAEDFAAPETAEHHDEEDVAAALERQTQDGKGDEDPGPSDWQGYATEGVEVEESK